MIGCRLKVRPLRFLVCMDAFVLQQAERLHFSSCIDFGILVLVQKCERFD